MRIVVLIKEVPDMEKVQFDSERGVVNRSKAPAEINPFDEHALQLAVNLKEEYKACFEMASGAGGIEVIALTMGPKTAEKSLRIAYARGVDRCVLLSDAALAGSDTCATAVTLGAAIKALGGADLILCGEKTVDGDTAQVGPETAEYLDIPHACYVGEIKALNVDCADVVCEDLGGEKQYRRMNYPSLLSVTKNAAMPKLATVKRRLESRTVEIEKLTLKDLEGYLKAEDTGFKGSPTKVAKVVVPKEVSRQSTVYRDDWNGFVAQLKNEFKKQGV